MLVTGALLRSAGRVTEGGNGRSATCHDTKTEPVIAVTNISTRASGFLKIAAKTVTIVSIIHIFD